MTKIEAAISLAQVAQQKALMLSSDPIGLTQFVAGVGERALIVGGGLAAISLAVIWLAGRGDKNRAKVSTYLYEDTASSRDRRESERFVAPRRARDFLINNRIESTGDAAHGPLSDRMAAREARRPQR